MCRLCPQNPKSVSQLHDAQGGYSVDIKPPSSPEELAAKERNEDGIWYLSNGQDRGINDEDRARRGVQEKGRVTS